MSKDFFAHALETVFNIEPKTTSTDLIEYPVVEVPVVEVCDPDNPNLIPAHEYDIRDASIDAQLSLIQGEALALNEKLKQSMATSDPRSTVKLGEIAVSALGTALEAVKQKSNIKVHKDKLKTNGGITSATTTINNNTIVVSRSELLRETLDDLD